MSQIHIPVHTKYEGTWPKDKKFYIVQGCIRRSERRIYVN